jgi:hypothetical protein
MTQDIIAMAREAGFTIDESLGVPYALLNEKTLLEFNVALERFAALVRADEHERNLKEYPVRFCSVKAFEDWCVGIRSNQREIDAKLAEDWDRDGPSPDPRDVAAAIRARGQE